MPRSPSTVMCSDCLREAFEGADHARVAILDAGQATLELANPAQVQVQMIDAVEADGQPSARIRVAFEVDDSPTATDELVRAGVELIAEPRETPWRSVNSRLRAAADLEVTQSMVADDVLEPESIGDEVCDALVSGSTFRRTGDMRTFWIGRSLVPCGARHGSCSPWD